MAALTKFNKVKRNEIALEKSENSYYDGHGPAI